MSEPVFKDINLHTLFRQQGYIRLPLFTEEQIGKLSTIYNTYREAHRLADSTRYFHATQDTGNSQLAREVDQAIKQVMLPVVQAHFCNYKVLIGAFLIKEPGQGSVHHLHQDWNFAQEPEHYSFNIWLPLQPTNRQNGCLRFLPGSHRIVPTIRPNFNFPWAFAGLESDIEPYLKEEPTTIGECICLDHSVIHSSWPNNTNEQRVVAILTLIPEVSDIKHYYCEDGQTIEEYTIQVDDIYTMRYGQRPVSGILVQKGRYNFPKIDKQQFADWIMQHPPTL